MWCAVVWLHVLTKWCCCCCLLLLVAACRYSLAAVFYVIVGCLGYLGLAHAKPGMNLANFLVIFGDRYVCAGSVYGCDASVTHTVCVCLHFAQ